MQNMQKVSLYIPFIICFILLLLLLDQSDCFVLQLPECGRYNGNFTERHDNKYFTTTIGDTIRNVTRRECGLHCTFFLGCRFFNHKMDNTECELLTSFKGELTPRPGWQFVSTSYKNVHLRGPLCRYLGDKVCPLKDTHCEDICAAPGFECKEDVNIARAEGVKAKASSEGNIDGHGRKAPMAIDGKASTYWAPEKESPDSWLLIDLGERRHVAYFMWMHQPKSRAEEKKGMKHLAIRIGDKDENDLNGNAVCVEELDISIDRNNRVFCTNGPMWGRYVVLQKGPAKRWFVMEIEIFALD